LRLLASAGFDSLLGVDPFIREEVHVGRTLRIEAKSIFEVQEDQFDLILFNHSLEHMPNHVGTLAHVRRLLASDGVCRISLPIAGSDPWRKYREHWVELDAPRHYFLHTPKSLSIAARNSGLSIFAVRHDGIPFGYWGSELYRRDISLRDGDLTRRPEAYFSTSDLHGFALESRRANLEGTAGRASFLLRIDQSMALERVCMVAPRGRAGSERP
jgi:SAM-dependent methyltransferase